MHGTATGQALAKLETELKIESEMIQRKTNELTKIEATANQKQQALAKLQQQVQTAELEVTKIVAQAKTLSDEISKLKMQRGQNESKVKQTLSALQKLTMEDKK